MIKFVKTNYKLPLWKDIRVCKEDLLQFETKNDDGSLNLAAVKASKFERAISKASSIVDSF